MYKIPFAVCVHGSTDTTTKKKNAQPVRCGSNKKRTTHHHNHQVKLHFYEMTSMTRTNTHRKKRMPAQTVYAHTLISA